MKNFTEEDFVHFKPGSFGCHEALHMASVIAEMIDDYLINHPTIAHNKEWLKEALDAHKKIYRLCQNIAEEHMKD
jgi:hypothetical protein